MATERKHPINVDSKYDYLIPLWEEWKDEILKKVPLDNEYINIKYGIQQETIQQYKNLNYEKFKATIPDELLAFYQIYDVELNVITSAFAFDVNGMDYCLLPFENIADEWEDIIGFNFDYDKEDILQDDGLPKWSDKLNIEGYSNPAWIPFAENKQGDYLMYDANPSKTGQYGQIIELQNESWERNIVANSLAELLESDIDKLKNNSEGKRESLKFILDKD